MILDSYIYSYIYYNYYIKIMSNWSITNLKKVYGLIGILHNLNKKE